MKKFILIKKKIDLYKKKSIYVEGDKSLSIRFVLSSLSSGKCIATNILKSEDVISAIKCIRKLGVKVNLRSKTCGFLEKDCMVLN